ncbi:MAG TPA: DNA gyrase subunit A, partial [Fibrobacteraceae bacterium]|nr:DNA gyrase subunit A [Fibrobacteraceae bacterium]
MSESKFIAGEHTQSLIERDMQDSYLRYSMSVIVARALPDVRDGLKPVHRRVLFGMHDLGVYPGKAYKKSARIVGDVIGKYHPHGDSAVYETLVRMAQDFSLRYPLVDGQGNFGSVDGDSAAAMRYTEARMARMGELMLEDLEKDTVDFNPNYDDSLTEPSVLPSAIPNLLVNGSTGIAVGMATNMPPHNLREIAQAIKAVIANPDIPVEDLLQFVTGPDFPTGATICGRAGIREAYLTGRGRVLVRAKIEAEQDSRDRTRLIVTEIPYMVNKSTLLEKIADLVRDKKIEGIADLRDESDRTGMRIVIDLKKDAVAEVVKNNLYKLSQLQDTFGINNMVIVNRRPMLLNLKELIVHYINHRHEIVVRRTQHDLKKAKERAHILEGLRIAQQNIDEVVRIIRSSSDTEKAKQRLRETFGLSEIQAQAIVDMRLRSLTSLEIDKIEAEYQELLKTIADYEDILANKERRMAIVQQRLDEIVAKYGDERRTDIEDSSADFEIEDLIPDEEQVITLTREGYIRRVSIDTFKTQGRGGKGVQGASLKDDDRIETLFTASTHSTLLIFTNQGRMHWTKVYKLPEGQRTGKGRPIINFLELQENERVSAIVPVRKYVEGYCLMMVTRQGTINKMALALFNRPRRAGINAIQLDEGD